jgi:uncharacterized protein (DUF433 family)
MQSSVFSLLSAKDHRIDLLNHIELIGEDLGKNDFAIETGSFFFCWRPSTLGSIGSQLLGQDPAILRIAHWLDDEMLATFAKAASGVGVRLSRRLADTSTSIVEKAVEQKVLALLRSAHPKRRLLPLHAVALAVAAKSLGRRLTVNDKKLVARELARLSPAALKTAKIEVAPSVVLNIGSLTRDAVERAERYTTARDSWIETAESVRGGRPVIKGTRLTVSAIYGRMSSGDTVQHLAADYPDAARGF